MAKKKSPGGKPPSAAGKQSRALARRTRRAEVHRRRVPKGTEKTLVSGKPSKATPRGRQGQ